MLEYNFDHTEFSIKFFSISLFTVLIGLILGGIIDASVRKLQKDGEWRERKYGKAFSFFVLQSSINIIILLMFTKSSKYFVPFLQLSISGALFSVLLFASQKNLADNALRVTNF
jgi:hypothetical protein